MYEVEIIFNLYTDNESSAFATYPTLQGVADYVKREAQGRGTVRVLINQKRVECRNGYLLGDDGVPFCTNEAWHEIFAKSSERILPHIPTNPQTLKDIGKPI